MTPIGEAETEFERRVERTIGLIPDLADDAVAYALAVPPVASPTHRGTASDCVRVERRDGSAAFLKLRHDDCSADISPAASVAARRAADLGVAPAVLFDSPETLALAFLDAPWRYARAGDLQDPAVLAAATAAFRRLHDAGTIGERFCPFERVAALAAQATEAGAPLPDETGRLVAACGLIGEAISASGVDRRFCHNHPVASNLMIDGPAVRLVDFDLAGDNDPWFDVGALMNDATFFDADRRAALELYAGRCEERVFNRCRLYGAVDDVMWGLWGVVRAVTSRRPGIEFYKYGTWRLSHARVTIASRDFEAWLRRL